MVKFYKISLTVVKFGEAGLEAVVLHAVLEFATGVLVIALDHLWVLLCKHCRKRKLDTWRSLSISIC